MRLLRFLIVGVTLCMADPAGAIQIIIQQTSYYNVLQFISSSPRANESLEKPPQSVTLTFSVAVDPSQSLIKVYDPYGNVLQTGALAVNSTGMTVGIPKLKPGYAGIYRVEWKAVCQCTDQRLLNGSFYFNIR